VLDLFAENAYLVVRNLKIIESMIGKKSSEHQMSIFEVALESFIDMTKFRKRIGEKGAEKIFKISLMVNAKEILTDRGYRGKKSVGSTDISIPTSGSSKKSYYQKRKARKKFCKRAGIEPVIGHLKSDHRMMRNYLKGTLGDAINTMMAAAAYNMRPWMNKNALSSFVSWLLTLVRRLENVLFENENQYAWKDSTLATVAK